MRTIALIMVAVSVALFAAVPVFAAPAYTLFGGATNSAGVLSLVSNLANADVNDDFSGVRLDGSLPATLADLTSLSLDYNVTDDDCGGGSPRFQLRVDWDMDNAVSAGDKNIFVYLGPAPSYTGCTPNVWTPSGNLVASADSRWDTSQAGGSFYDTYADAATLTAGKALLRISVVVDSGWMFGDAEQEVLVDNAEINGEVYDFVPVIGPPTTKDSCKDGGWMTFNNPVFKNQGDCVSYVQSNSNAVGNKTK